MKFIMRLLMLCSILLAGEAVQTDWSDGVNAGGTVTEWGSCFLESANVSSYAVPGLLCLSSQPLTTEVETVVNDSLPLSRMDAGDLDGDGFIDLVGTSLVFDHMHWFRNIDGCSWTTVALQGSFAGGLGCAIADIDGDGYPDVIGAMENPDMVVYWKNDAGNGPSGDPVVVDPFFHGAHCVEGCDVDGDGKTDIMGAANQCDEIAVWYNLGGDSFEKFVIDSTVAGTQCVSPGDINGDGNIDAVGASMDLGEFAWWENPGNRTDPWDKHSIGNKMPYAHHVVAVDMNRDGLTDVLGTSFIEGKIVWYENDGTSSDWDSHTVALNLGGAVTAMPADFDGDGDIDVAGAAWGINRLMWYENTDGTAENWQARLIAAGFKGAWPLTCGDFDNNGRIELAAGADVLTSDPSHGPSVFDLCEFLASGSLVSSVLDTQENPQWSSFQFQGDRPAGTGLEFYWKSSGDPNNLGDWIGPFTCGADLSGEVFRYVQYKVELSSSNPLVSPLLHDISLFWDPNGITSSEVSSPLVILQGNPACSGCVRLIPSDACSEISLMDISGRKVASQLVAEPGETVVFTSLPAGAYLIHALSGNRESFQKVMVL